MPRTLNVYQIDTEKLLEIIKECSRELAWRESGAGHAESREGRQARQARAEALTDAAHPDLYPKRCEKAPLGWHCTREGGHDGPCAAVGNTIGTRRPEDVSLKGPSDGLEPWREAAESARKTAAELLRIAGGMAKASSVLLVTQRPDHAQRIPFLGYREVLAACDFLLEARMSLLEAAQEFEAT